MAVPAILALLVTGCDPSGPSAGTSAQRTVAPGTRADDPAHPDVVPVAVTLRDLGQRANFGEEGAFAIGARYVVRPDPEHHTQTVVTRREGDGEVLRHTAPTGFHTDYAGLSGDFLVLADDRSGSAGAAEPARIVVANLETGTTTSVTRIPGAPAPAPGGTGASIADNRLYYSALGPAKSAGCVGEIDFATLRGRTLTCGSTARPIVALGPADHGVSWVLAHGTATSACREGRAIDAGSPVPVGPATDCGTSDTAVLSSWQIWGSYPPGPRQQTTSLSATDGTTTVDLGDERRASLLVCDGYAYWSPDADRQSIVRWQPGGNIETIYAVADNPDNTWSYADTCADGILTVRVDRYDPVAKLFSAQLFALG